MNELSWRSYFDSHEKTRVSSPRDLVIHEPESLAMSDKQVESKRIFCAIVGAGMCGVTLADRLLATGALRHEELIVFDRSADFGGVWESNKYPGAACDIPSHAYVVRAFLNPGKHVRDIDYLAHS
jgi:hypothetical protein